MTIETEDLINSILQSLERIDYIKLEDIPNIDLYMDQVTTFMGGKLHHSTRNAEDKILTKTMINNYAKNDLLPPPLKKKYNKEHILILIFIYYYKGILSIGDIQTLLNPLTDKFFGSKEDFNLESIYKEVFSLEKNQVEAMKKDLLDKYALSKEILQDGPDDSKAFLELFSFICILSFDVYVKKMLIEKLIDEFLVKNPNKQEDKAKSKQDADKQNGGKQDASK